MIKIYTGRRMGSSMRTHWLLAEIGKEYEEIKLDMTAKEHKSPEYLSINPMGQVPAMVDGDFKLSESLAINNYIAEKYESDLNGSTNEEKAKIWQWSLWATYNLQKHFGEVLLERFAGRDTAPALEKVKDPLASFMKILDDQLLGKEYIVGDRFTLADINVGTTMTYCEAIGYDFSEFTNAYKWYWGITQRPAYITATGQESERV